jgi:RNA polymerase sigma-70 factor (ECF subfamily)
LGPVKTSGKWGNILPSAAFMVVTAGPNSMSAASASAANPSPAVSDEAMLQRLRSGEAAAGDELVRRYYQPLLRYLQRLTSSQIAEELLQQTWLSVLDHADKFDPASSGGAFKAWLFRIATNKANDFWRSCGREKRGQQELRLVKTDEAPASDERLEADEQAGKLRWAIAQLPENQREVLMLRYYSELKFVEIAEILGCPLNTALGRAHKAILKLRQLMESQMK